VVAMATHERHGRKSMVDQEVLDEAYERFGIDPWKPELARQAEIGLRATPNIRTAISKGHSAVKIVGRVVYVANGRGGVVDDFRLDEVVRAVSPISVPPMQQTAAVTATSPGESVGPAPGGAQLGATSPDALEQLRKLADLHQTGVLTDAEFEAKKGELLRRI
jgi:Short C-terminal domain